MYNGPQNPILITKIIKAPLVRTKIPDASLNPMNPKSGDEKKIEAADRSGPVAPAWVNTD